MNFINSVKNLSVGLLTSNKMWLQHHHQLIVAILAQWLPLLLPLLL